MTNSSFPPVTHIPHTDDVWLASSPYQPTQYGHDLTIDEPPPDTERTPMPPSSMDETTAKRTS